MSARVDWMTETLKGFRSSWLTVAEYAEVIGGNVNRAYDELKDLEDNGILVSRTRDVSVARARGLYNGKRSPIEYTLTKAWGGNG